MHTSYTASDSAAAASFARVGGLAMCCAVREGASSPRATGVAPSRGASCSCAARSKGRKGEPRIFHPWKDAERNLGICGPAARNLTADSSPTDCRVRTFQRWTPLGPQALSLGHTHALRTPETETVGWSPGRAAGSRAGVREENGAACKRHGLPGPPSPSPPAFLVGAGWRSPGPEGSGLPRSG